MRLTVSRPKRFFFFFLTPISNKFRLILTVKKFQGISDLTLLSGRHGLPTPEGISKLEKLVTMLSKKIPKTITLPYILLNLKILSILYSERPRQPPKHNS